MFPVFACTIADRKNVTSFAQHATGYGCHPIAAVALARAITEAAQSRVTHISGLREDLTWSRYREEFMCDAEKNKSWLATISNEPSTIDFDKIRAAPNQQSYDMLSLLRHVLGCLRKAGLRSAIVVDMAATEVFSVVFVCVPDLEYLTPKARILYTPGARMRAYIKENEGSLVAVTSA